MALICARRGSKGLPRKNLRLLRDKPLLGWAIEVARQCPSVDRVIVSTEDEEIAAVATRYGAEVPFMRPAILARDDASERAVWQHAIRELESLKLPRPDVLVCLSPTAPLRTVGDVEACVAELLRNPDADMVITVTPSQRSPYYNMVTIDDGWAQLTIRPPNALFHRQDAPEVFDVTTVAYASRTEAVLAFDYYFDCRVRMVVVPQKRALDIDEEEDLAYAEFILARASRKCLEAPVRPVGGPRLSEGNGP